MPELSLKEKTWTRGFLRLPKPSQLWGTTRLSGTPSWRWIFLSFVDISQLCDHRNDEIKRQADLARRREREEKRQKAQTRASKLKAVKDRRIQSITSDAPVDSSVPLQQIPPSPLPEEETRQQAEPVVMSLVVAQETDVIDILLNWNDEENVVPEQQAPWEVVDEEIEVEKAVSSPLKDMQVEPSGSIKEDDMVEGEQAASRGNTTPVSSSGGPTQMEVDPAPGSLASQPE
jgi:hypothetical protein